ncbi:MAG: enoyl-CoA hydratase/isomerase family protein [Novosphingobium sp.]|nr:enoyl-CoA hydratase/isomerase family protein [Novosphingobium sp.]
MSAADTTEQIVLIQRDGALATLTLNRPDRLNALNNALLTGLRDAMRALAADDTIYAVVITGAGRAFCAGADLSDMSQVNTKDLDDPSRANTRNVFDELEEAFETFPKPLIAAVNGLGVGFGFTMLGYCDHVFVAEGARLRTPFSQLGLCPEASASYTFPMRMGWAEASRALMMGEWFTAADVVASGLAQEVVAADALIATALGFARRYEQCPLQSLKATKELMLAAHLPHIRAAREAENAKMRDLLGTPANKQALADFASRERKAKG